MPLFNLCVVRTVPLNISMDQILIVGAGCFGSVLAERVACEAGIPVTVIDRREHIGGNCWSETDPWTGVEYHKYGSHIFHTSNETVWKYISRFTSFNNYRHTVWTTHQDHVYSMPINLGTINAYYNKNFSPSQARTFLQEEIRRGGAAAPRNFEEKAISLIGRPLYDAFIHGYTRKQWEKDPRELSTDVIDRLPVRYTYNNRYFDDTFEGVPLDGYGKLFERLLRHPKISVRLNTDYADMKPQPGDYRLICWTGPIDAFFEYSLGRLEWRTVDFEVERFDYADFQGAAVMNFADQTVPYTRIHEFKHYHPEREDTGRTLVFKEYSRFAREDDEPYYPVDTENNRALYGQYRELAREKAPGVIFGGRLGHCRYYDMDDAVEAALACWRDEVAPRLGR